VPGVAIAGTCRFEELFLNSFLEKYLVETIDWYIYVAMDVSQHPGDGPLNPEVAVPTFALWYTSEKLYRCQLVDVSSAQLRQYAAGLWSFNDVCGHHPDDRDDDYTVLNKKQQYLYLIVSERLRAVKVGVTGISEFKLIKRYSNALGQVDSHIYIPIKNGKR
jgi:hypothetical protein